MSLSLSLEVVLNQRPESEEGSCRQSPSQAVERGEVRVEAGDAGPLEQGERVIGEASRVGLEGVDEALEQC
jgi:hypothetical protein